MEVTKVLDAKGLACPVPIVRTKKMDELQSGFKLQIKEQKMTLQHGQIQEGMN